MTAPFKAEWDRRTPLQKIKGGNMSRIPVALTADKRHILVGNRDDYRNDSLTPDEARALAQNLVHHAALADGWWLGETVRGVISAHDEPHFYDTDGRKCRCICERCTEEGAGDQCCICPDCTSDCHDHPRRDGHYSD